MNARYTVMVTTGPTRAAIPCNTLAAALHICKCHRKLHRHNPLAHGYAYDAEAQETVPGSAWHGHSRWQWLQRLAVALALTLAVPALLWLSAAEQDRHARTPDRETRP